MNRDSIFIRRADHGARVLVVDTDAGAQRTLRSMLEAGHYLVEITESGPEALECLHTFQPDLVLLDTRLPGMDGFEICRRIRAIPNGDLLPIIILTEDDRPEAHSEAFRAKGDDILRKSALSSELIVRIRSLLRLKRMQAEIQAERDTLLDLQRQRERLFGFIVHDLKNPLTTIQLGLELMSESGSDEPHLLTQLLRLQETAAHMGRMIQDILDIGKREQAELELRKCSIRLREWIPELLQEIESQASRLNHRLEWDCHEDLEIKADPSLLRRLLLNLIDNALKYSPPGSQTLLAAYSVDGACRLEVRDQGPGIPDHLRDHIFEMFFRLGDEEGQMRTGSGLGLAFCQLVAEAHRGRIWVEPALPNGSMFVLELPNIS